MQGYDVVLVHEASDVITTMKGSSHPDLVLLSYKLPGLTGQQVCGCCKLTTSCSSASRFNVLLNVLYPFAACASSQADAP